MTDIVSLLKQINAIITDDHFVYTSGRHGSVYVRKDMLYPHTKETSQVCMLFAEKFKDKDVDVVVAPATGGIILSQWTAYHLSTLKNKEILSIFTEKDQIGTQVFKRGYDAVVKDKNVLIVEDLTTTGGSVKKVVENVTLAGGKIIAVCTMINRDPDHVNTQTMGIPFYELGIFKAESFDPNNCPLCKKRVPINITIGHGKTYVASSSSLHSR